MQNFNTYQNSYGGYGPNIYNNLGKNPYIQNAGISPNLYPNLMNPNFQMQNNLYQNHQQINQIKPVQHHLKNML